MHRPTPVQTPEDRARFCAAGGLPLSPQTAARQAPDFSFFLEDPGNQPVARCSLWWRQTPPCEGHRVGFVGHYAVSDPQAAPPLLDQTCRRLAAAGCTLAIGPVDGNTWQRYRFLTERGSEPRFFLEPDNPDEWPSQLTAAGFAPLAHYGSALNPDLAAGLPDLSEPTRRLAERGITIEPLRPERFEAEMRRIHALSLLSFRDNFLYTPISEPDFLAQYTPIRPHLRPELVLLAEHGGELVGFVFGLPDLLQAQRGQAGDTVLVKTLAVRPDHGGLGLGSVLMTRCQQAAREVGFRRAIHALFHESNRSGRISAHTAQVFRRYMLFARPLGGPP